MNHSFFKGRTLAWLVLALALCASLLLLKQPATTNAAGNSGPINAGADGSAIATENLAELEMEGVLQSGSNRGNSAGQPPIQRSVTAASGQGAIVRAVLTTTEDEPGPPPKDCEGWTVIATTREQRSGEVTQHTARVNAQGVAEFVFSEQIKLVGIACLPPLDSGFGVAKHDDFVELEQGEDYEAQLYFSAAFRARGRVIDLDGVAVSGAEVHAFNFGMGPRLEDWRPGLLIATTDHNGIFQFEQMHQEVWVAAVQPRNWLMIDPIYEDQSDGKGVVSLYNAAAFENPNQWDFGTLQVMAIDRTLLTVTDGANQPAVGLFGYAAPLLLNDPRLTQTPSSEKTSKYVPVEMRAFMSNLKASELAAENGLEAPFDFGHVDGWPYAEVWFRTNTNGQAHLALPDGKWRLKLFPPDALLAEEELPALDFTTGSGHLEYQLPTAIGAIRGRLIFADGSPAKYGDLYIYADSDPNAILDFGTMSAKDGSFEFPALELGAHFTVQAIPDDRYSNFIATKWNLQATASNEVQDFVVDAGFTTTVHFTAEGYDLDSHRFRLRANQWFPAAGTTTPERDAWWSTVQELILNISTKPVVLPMMPAGKVEYLVMADVGTGAWASNGHPYTRSVEWSRVMVEVGAVDQEIELKLEGYEEPPSSIAKHEGVVLDQSTGQPIRKAHVFLWRENQSDSSKSFVTNAEGHFQFSNGSGAYLLMASAAGYAPRTLPVRDYAAGEHEHQIMLEPLQNRFSMQIVDRDGAAVPACTVTFPNGAGQNTSVFHNRAYFSKESCALTTENAGRLSLIGMKPGSQAIHIDFWGVVAYDLAFLAPNMEGQQVKVVLPVSLQELRELLQAAP
jgi:hypothetical protein